MGTRVIVLSRELPAAVMGLLGKYGDVKIGGGNPNAAVLNEANIYIATAVDPVPAALIENFPNSLGLIANIGVGTDNIDLAAAHARGIRVSNTPVVSEDTADLTLALLLATCRRLSVFERLLRDGDWNAAQAQLGQRVHGKTLGIVGFGAIGQALARRAAGFDMNILYHGPNRKHAAEQLHGATYRTELNDLLAQSDIVSLHCALTPATRHILDATGLGRMKPGAFLINTGRGPLVDEAALVDALASGHLGGAGLDVFEFEPEVTPALRAFDNVTLLPHIGSATGECRQDMVLRALANIQSFADSGSVLDPVGA